MAKHLENAIKTMLHENIGCDFSSPEGQSATNFRIVGSSIFYDVTTEDNSTKTVEVSLKGKAA